MMTDKVQKKDMEIKELKDLLSKAASKFETVLKKYYPEEYEVKDEDKQRTVSAFEFYRKENYPVLKLHYPGIHRFFKTI